MNERILAAVLLIDVSALVGIVDGLYFHLYKYKLYAHAASRREHWTHTLRAILFAPIVLLLFALDVGGVALWAATALLLVDFAIESWDVLIEGDSRATLGGLTPLESWIHVASITTHVAAVTLVLAAKPAGAWGLSAPSLLPGAWPAIARWTALLLVAGGVGLAGLHLWLLQPRYRDRGAAAAAPRRAGVAGQRRG